MNNSGIAFSSDGTTIGWSASGSGQPLVVIDPIMVDRDLSPNGPLVDELRRNFTVIRYDRRGKGDSVHDGPYTPEGEIDDLSAVIAVASPDEKPSVYGLSSGGSLALLAASRGAPMKTLVVMEPPSELPGVEAFIAETESAIAAGDTVGAVRAFYAYQGMPPEVIAQMTPFVEACAPYARTIPVDLRITEILTPEVLGRVEVPTLAVASQASPPQLQEFAERVAQHVESCHVAMLDGDWHGVPDDVLARRIAEFVLADGASAEDTESERTNVSGG